MSKEILRKFFDGKLYIAEMINPNTIKYKKAIHSAGRKFNVLVASLNRSQMLLLQSYLDDKYDCETECQYEAFCLGMKTGGQLMISMLKRKRRNV